MSQILQCPSCGGSNQMPDGRNSMFCAFCGIGIQNNNSTAPSVSSSKKTLPKSKIIDGKISYIKRNIESIEEIVDLYSDSELEQVKELEIQNNNIKSTDGLDRFCLKELNFSGNQLTRIDAIPDFGRTLIYVDAYIDVEFNFSNNLNLNHISENVIEKINQIGKGWRVRKFSLIFDSCPNLNIDLLAKIDFRKLRIEKNDAEIVLVIDSALILPSQLQEQGFRKSNNIFYSNYSNVWKLSRVETNGGSFNKNESHEIGDTDSNEANNNKPTLASTFNLWNWIHLLSPFFLAFIGYYLGHKWEIDETNFAGCIAGASIFVLFISLGIVGVRFSNRREKTGRSFDTNIGRLDEYQTVYANANVSSYFWSRLLLVWAIHIIIVVISLKIESYYNKGINNQSSSSEAAFSSQKNGSSSYENSLSNNYSDRTSSDSNYAPAKDKILESIPNTTQEISTVQIGEQLWMDYNLDVSNFNNGDIIPEAKNIAEWKSFCANKQPVWCYYLFDIKNKRIGKLYNIYAVIDNRGMSPNGFHIPKMFEWNRLLKYLGGNEHDNRTGDKLVSEDINYEYLGGSKGKFKCESGFNAIICGQIETDWQTHTSYFWSSQEPNSYIYDGKERISTDIMYLSGSLKEGYSFFEKPVGEYDGCFIRCLKD
jgi:uncharacterized protein (TIGR02145 family)